MSEVFVRGSIEGSGNIILVTLDANGAFLVTTIDKMLPHVNYVRVRGNMEGNGRFISVNVDRDGVWKIEHGVQGPGSPCQVVGIADGPYDSIWAHNDLGIMSFSGGLNGRIAPAQAYRSAGDRLAQQGSGLSTAQALGFNVATSASYRIRRVIPAGVYSGGTLNLKLSYANWYTASSPSVNEFKGPGTLTVAVGIEYNTNSALKQWAPADAGARYVTGTWNGQATGTIEPGGLVDADVAIPLVAGAIVYYELIYVACALGWPVGITLQPAGTNYDQYSIANDFHAGSAAWSNSAPAAFSAVRIRTATAASVRGLLAFGDSIIRGTGYNPSDASYVDIGNGWTVGAASAQSTYPLQKIAQGGEEASFWASRNNLRKAMVKAENYSAIMWGVGTNDLANGQSLDALKANTFACLAILASFQKPITLVTLLPRTVSGNVNPPNGNYVAYRNAYNAWIYTLIGRFNVVGVFDAAATVENAPGSITGTGDNTWANIRFTTDYIHPSGGAVGSGTAGVLGTTGAGGGHSTIAVAFAQYLATLTPWTINQNTIKYGVGWHIITLASTNDVATFDIMAQRNLRVMRIDAAMADDTDATLVPRMNALLALARPRNVSLLPILFPPFQFGDATDNGKYPAGDSYALYQQGYVRARDFALAFKDEPNILGFELGNEINLLQLDGGGLRLFGKGWYASEFSSSLLAQWASVLRGMSDGIEYVNLRYGKSLRRVLTTTSTMFGFIDFMILQGVKVDVVEYHLYDPAGRDYTNYYADYIDLLGAHITSFNLWNKFASYNRPVIIGETNASEIYDGAYGDIEGDTKTEAGFVSLQNILKAFTDQTTCHIEAILAYELFNEPAKIAPENHFGVMTDLATPKVSMALLSYRSRGYLSNAELAKLSSRVLLS